MYSMHSIWQIYSLTDHLLVCLSVFHFPCPLTISMSSALVNNFITPDALVSFNPVGIIISFLPNNSFVSYVSYICRIWSIVLSDKPGIIFSSCLRMFAFILSSFAFCTSMFAFLCSSFTFWRNHEPSTDMHAPIMQFILFIKNIFTLIKSQLSLKDHPSRFQHLSSIHLLHHD